MNFLFVECQIIKNNAFGFLKEYPNTNMSIRFECRRRSEIRCIIIIITIITMIITIITATNKTLSKFGFTVNSKRNIPRCNTLLI